MGPISSHWWIRSLPLISLKMKGRGQWRLRIPKNPCYSAKRGGNTKMYIYNYIYIADGSAEIDFCSVWQKHSETGFWTMWSGILSKKDSRVSLNLILPIIRTRQAIIHPGRHDCVYFGWKEFCENDDIDSTSMMGIEEFQFPVVRSMVFTHRPPCWCASRDCSVTVWVWKSLVFPRMIGQNSSSVSLMINIDHDQSMLCRRSATDTTKQTTN